jgi:hypothetical protein
MKIFFFTFCLSIFIVLLSIYKRQDIGEKVEHFEEVKNAWSLVQREHGVPVDDDSKIVITKRMTDGIPKNTTVDAECRKIKVWFYQQIEANSDIFKLDSKSFSMLTIGRKDDLHCISPESTARIINDIKERELVVRRDTIKYKNDKHLIDGYEIAPEDRFKDTLEREYCAFFIGSNDEETEAKDFDIHVELNKEQSEVVFFTKPMKSDFYRDQGFGQRIGLGSTFCKIAVDPQVNEKKQIPLQDSQYKKFFRKVDKGIFEIVYQNSMTKKYVQLNGIKSLTDFRNKYCVMNCSKIDPKPNLWRAYNENMFKRVNFVDVVTNPTKMFCGETTDNTGKKISTRNELIKRQEDIDPERFKYNELKDMFTIRFEYNSDKFFYFRGDPKFQIPMTECDVGYTYETVKPTRKDIDEQRWINVLDRTCVNVNPCDKLFHTNLKFAFKTKIENIPSYEFMKLDAIKVPKISQFMICKGIQINCNLTVRGMEDVLSIRPLFIVRKKNKEVVLKAVLGESGQTSLLAGNDQDSTDKPTTIKCKEGSLPPTLGNMSEMNLFMDKSDVLSPYKSEEAALSWHSTWKKDVKEIDCLDKKPGEMLYKKEQLGYVRDKNITDSDKLLFQEFNVFEEDQFEFLVKTGTSSVSLSDLSVVMKCQHSEIVVKPATYSSNNTCDIQTYEKCDHDTQFHDIENQFKCKKYGDIKAGCPTMKFSEIGNIPCEVNKYYQKYQTRKQNLDILHSDSTELNVNFNDCQKRCDERVGCTGVDYEEQTRECVFRGHETYKIKFYGIDKNAKRKVSIVYDNGKKQDTDVGDLNIFTLSKPGFINQITVVGGTLKKIEFFRHDNTIYKTYNSTQLEKYRHTPQLMLIDDIYADSVKYDDVPSYKAQMLKMKADIKSRVEAAIETTKTDSISTENNAKPDPAPAPAPTPTAPTPTAPTPTAPTPTAPTPTAPTPTAPTPTAPTPTQPPLVVPKDDASLPKCYGARYWDLRAAFGSDDGALKGHYTSNGNRENRDYSCTLTDAEAKCYIDRYEDVKEFAGADLNKARAHYYETGMSENRDFVCPPGVKELKCYVQRYAELQKDFGTDYDAPGTQSTLFKAGLHWFGTGEKENRDYSCEETSAPAPAAAAEQK